MKMQARKDPHAAFWLSVCMWTIWRVKKTSTPICWGVSLKKQKPGPLANGIRLVLVQTVDENVSAKKGFLPAAGQIELELETRELLSIWKNLTTAFIKSREWISLETQQMLQVLSPTGLLLTLRQKMFG